MDSLKNIFAVSELRNRILFTLALLGSFLRVSLDEQVCDRILAEMRGNPLALSDITSIAARETRLALRPNGAGAQLLLLSLLHKFGQSLEQIVIVSPPCPTGPDVGSQVAETGVPRRSSSAASLGPRVTSTRCMPSSKGCASRTRSSQIPTSCPGGSPSAFITSSTGSRSSALSGVCQVPKGRMSCPVRA